MKYLCVVIVQTLEISDLLQGHVKGLIKKLLSICDTPEYNNVRFSKIKNNSTVDILADVWLTEQQYNLLLKAYKIEYDLSFYPRSTILRIRKDNNSIKYIEKRD